MPTCSSFLPGGTWMLAVPSTASPAEKINRPPPLLPLLGTPPSPGAASAARARPFTLVSVTSSVHAGPHAPPKSACMAAGGEKRRRAAR